MADGRRAEFEAVFGIGGAWTRLLCRADGYLVTEVWCKSPQARQYRVKDFWSWHRNFEIFRARHQEDFEHLEERLRSEGLVEKEQFLGAYYEEREDGAGEDLVLR